MTQVIDFIGGEYRNRTGVHGFAIRCVTTPPTRLFNDLTVAGGVLPHCLPHVLIFFSGARNPKSGSFCLCSPCSQFLSVSARIMLNHLSDVSAYLSK